MHEKLEEARAEGAKAAFPHLDAFTRASYGKGYESLDPKLKPEAITRLITGLLHLASYNGFNPVALSNEARTRSVAERMERALKINK